MKTLLLSVAIVLICVLLLGIKVLFVKGGKFPTGHAHELMARQRKKH